MRGCEITLSDGSSFFIPSSLADRHFLTCGAILTPGEAEHLRREGDFLLAKQRGLDLLSRRDHSCSELKLKLTQKGFSIEGIRRVIDDFLRLGYLDDRRFAESWLESRLRRHPEGRSLLLAGLAKKGVSRQVAADVLAELHTEEDADQAFLQAADKLLRKRSMTRDKFLRSMQRLGFSWGQIQSYADSSFDTLSSSDCDDF